MFCGVGADWSGVPVQGNVSYSEIGGSVFGGPGHRRPAVSASFSTRKFTNLTAAMRYVQLPKV